MYQSYICLYLYARRQKIRTTSETNFSRDLFSVEEGHFDIFRDEEKGEFS